MDSLNIRSFLFISLFSSCSLSAVYSQQQSENIYTAFDLAAGFENIGTNNGLVHLNNDRSDNKTDRYYNNQYLLGDVFYDGQQYFGSSLKYDIHKDILIAKVTGESSIGIELIKSKTASFSLDGRKFVHLNFNNKPVPEFINGYYEWISAGKNLQLYIKHHKDRIEATKREGFITNYESSDSFVIWYKNEFYQIRSQQDYLALFPEHKQAIDSFYQNNYTMRKSDPKQFMRNLFAFTGTLISKDLQ